MDKIELKARLQFRKDALTKLRAAYLALVDGSVKSYMIENRQLTKLDIDTLKNEIEEMENELDELEALLAGYKRRRAFGIVPRDW